MAEAPRAALKIELVRSPISGTERQRATVRALGLRKLHQVVERTDSASVRGMVQKVAHLVRILED
jgi:large subunit ribosomal protein L30